MLSPKIKTQLEIPINFFPIIKASAIPLGFFCIAYDIFIPNFYPFPRRALNDFTSFLLVIIRTSFICANIKTDNG